MTTPEELQELASQLSKPDGAKGIEIADMMHATNIRMTLHSIAHLNIEKDQTILELGHGNAGHLEKLIQDHPSVSYHGLEISELMHEEGKRKNIAHIEAKKAFFQLYDGVTLPFPENYFDKIFTVNTVYFWKEPIAMLAELYRVLKSGGWLNISFAQRSFMERLPFTQYFFELYDTQKMENLVRNTPFKIVASETQTETVMTKTGDKAERTFTAITLEK